MIHAILIDDEVDSIKVLQRLLHDYCPEVQIAGIADGVETGIKIIQATKPDLLFLDIEMKQGNAFDLLNRLGSFDFQIIFITAFDNYAIKAFKYSALDYLLKPINIDELKSAIRKVQDKKKDNLLSGQMQSFLQQMQNYQLLQKKIAIPAVDGMVFVNINQIIRCEAKVGYTYVITDNKEKILTSRSIKEYEDLLPPALFCRIHNSHIINLEKIKKYFKGRGGSVIMDDGASIEVAARRRDEFLSRFIQ